MEVSGARAAVAVYVGLVSIVIALAWRVLNWVWFGPKRLERFLRQQGLSGNSYRFLFGDLKESSMMTKEAKSKPMNLSHDITPRAGPIPTVTVSNPKDAKDIFARHGDFQKPYSNSLVKSLATGLANYEDGKWAKHRRIINPAFNIEKLKHQAQHSEMISKWEALVSKEGLCELDVWPCLQNLSANVISRTAFGSSYQEGRKIFQLLIEPRDHHSVACLDHRFVEYVSNWQQLAREEVTMILNEVLRLYPPAFAFHQKVHKETQLGKLTLPAGGQIIVPTLLVHHDKEL
ncbi:hypothetical protein FEM48_Zijuj12G0124700 [Ziziphus jujuba var. spinosa]|uniref:Cytochrome P450 CYP72A219-like n=1 Tax=Ziziphus jujuba var. spinosa TaxID=714518 RepID=A0A978UDB9_ZIZJJ|nr:hypothetical protein FEM48_Zijuj12G0124700 [Ziziphus jujuba var. spinosa]